MFEIKFYKYEHCHTVVKCCNVNQAAKLLADYRPIGMCYLWQSKKYVGEYAIVKELNFE